MVNYEPGIVWKLLWYLVTPALIIFILIYGFIDYTPASFGDYIFPPWAEAIGWILAVVSIVVVFVYIAWYLATSDGSLKERLKTSITPTKEWGPALNVNREEAGYPLLPNENDPDEFNNQVPTQDAEFGNRTPPPQYSNIAYVAEEDVKVTTESKGVDTTELKEFTKT